VELLEDPLRLGGPILLLRAAAVATGNRCQAMLVEATNELGDSIGRAKPRGPARRRIRGTVGDGQHDPSPANPIGTLTAGPDGLLQDPPFCGREGAEGIFLRVGHTVLPARQQRAWD